MWLELLYDRILIGEFCFTFVDHRVITGIRRDSTKSDSDLTKLYKQCAF